MRKLVEESNTKKKAKKKTKDKSSKKPNAVPNAIPKANTIAAYAAKANTIAESLGKLSKYPFLHLISQYFAPYASPSN